MRYIPLTDSDRREMLAASGKASIDDLFSTIPPSVLRLSPPNLPTEKTEMELRSFFSQLAQKNDAGSVSGWLSFLGGGSYDHFIPSVVDTISSRGEFSTAYTPYQPEASQGTLQAIFEFQSMIANLFSLDVANASMYDGASSVAEAVMMAARIRRKARKVYVSQGVHPEYFKVIRGYLGDADLSFEMLPLTPSGQTSLPEKFEEPVALLVQQPNYFGVIEDISSLSEKVHREKGLMLVGTTESLAYGLLKGPGSQGADIVAGEAQSFGSPLSFGGPYVGVFAAKEAYLRQLPGRLVGRAKDSQGRDGYVLTLAAREQHIRRDKATSNICTNHSLCALRACVYLALMGKRGLREVAHRNTWAAQKLRFGLSSLPGVSHVYEGHVFNEFALRLPVSARQYLSRLEEEKIIGGIPLLREGKEIENEILVTATETKEEKDIDRYISMARKAIS